MDNDDLEDFMDNYNKTALIKTSNKNKRDCKIVCVRMNDSLNLFL